MVATPVKSSVAASTSQTTTVQTQIADKFAIGDGQPLALLAGPCVIESEDFTLKMADEIKKGVRSPGGQSHFQILF